MWRIIDYLYAGSMVAYDKVSECASYYIYGEQIKSNYSNDNLDNYNSIIDVTKYENENDSKRILPEVGVLEKYWALINEPTHIVDNIYLGSAFNAASKNDLQELNIKVIINVTKEISDYYPNDFIYVHYDISDNNKTSINKYLNKAYDQIKYHQNNTEGNILIHCFMGRSRSASVVIYYLMKTQFNSDGTPFTFDDALEFIKNKRAIVNPTFRFTKDLAKSIIL